MTLADDIAIDVGTLGDGDLTITGLINTFSALKNTNPAEKDEKLSAGIAEAMYNTAYGLSIALLCMIAHLLLSAAMKRVVSDLEAFSLTEVARAFAFGQSLSIT